MAKETNKQPRYWHSEMKYRDIKKLAIEMGMPFPDVVNGDFYSMVSFIDSGESQKRNPALVEEFDKWMEKILLDRGADYLVKPSLRLSYVSDEKREEVENTKKEKKEKKPKKVVEKDSNNLIKGTKKSYTFELAKKGYDIERIKRRVLKKFPDASEKSIVIWYRAAMGLRNQPKVKKEKKVKKPKKVIEKTPEELALLKQRARERKLARKERMVKANERTEEHRKQQRKSKRGKKKKAL